MLTVHILIVVCFSILCASEHITCAKEVLDTEDPNNYCSTQYAESKRLAAGTWCLIRPERVKPTQVYIGKVEMECTKAKIEGKSSSGLKNLLYDNEVPTVVGPNGTFYITDHHHFATALFQAFLDFKRPMIHRVLYACIQADYSTQTQPRFWQTMVQQNLVFLQNEYGMNVSVDSLPKNLKGMVDNPYRTLSTWLRSSHAFIKCGQKQTIPLPQCKNQVAAIFYLECFWAKFIHAKFPLNNYPEYPVIEPPLEDWVYSSNLQSQVEALQSIYVDAIKYAGSPAAHSMPGFNLSPDILPPTPLQISPTGCIIKDKPDNWKTR